MKFLLRQNWFKPEKVTHEVERAQNRYLKKAGAYVRKIARDFLKHKTNPNISSEAPHSPYDHFGIRNSILFATQDNAAYIGPRLIKAGINNVARRHEFGGKAAVKAVDTKLIKGVSIGDTAPITIAHFHRGDIVIKDKAEIDPKTSRKVVWVKIRTKSQAEHSTRLYKRMIRHSKETVEVTYPPRPFMFPALNKSLPYLPKLWKDSLKK